MTHDTWHLTCDMWWDMNILSKYQLPSSYGLGVMLFWRFEAEGWLTDWLNQWMTGWASLITDPPPTRQCEIKDIKLYQARTKVIDLGWYWVTIIFFGQINPKNHCSPGMHNVQVITRILSYKSVKAFWKWTIFCSFMVQFLLITCFCSHISLKDKLHAHTLHTFLTSSAF